MADASMSYLYTVGGYATLIGVGYALYHVSTHKANRRAPTSASRGVKAPHQEPRKEDRKKKQRMESFASETHEAAKAKARGKPADEHGVQQTLVAHDTSDDGDDNREFARQLAKAQEGTKLASKTEGAKQREKSVKQSRANQMTTDKVVADKPSAPSSTTGADADDDQSPLSSPKAGPADVGGVSDMLEPAPAGPSVLRITDSGAKKPKQKAAKAPEKTETKKQRQNRKKAEAAKAARDEAEKERKVLEEKQRRTARIAEGRAAKDGSQFQAADGARSAWAHGNTNGSSNASEAAALHRPLDTFEKPATTAANQSPPAVKSDSSWISSLPSEEEQMEMLKDEADDWSTVKTKSSKKAARKASSISSTEELAPSQPASQPKQAAAAVPAAAKPSKAPAPQNFGGSFSALTTNDDGADEVEEEWDVKRCIESREGKPPQKGRHKTRMTTTEDQLAKHPDP